MPINSIVIRQLNLCPWKSVSDAMHKYTIHRNNKSYDELWLVEHYPIFTQGRFGSSKHILEPTNIEVIKSDRGGQVTYHGPGQQIMYVLIDLKRRKISVHQLISILEQTVIKTLSYFKIRAHNRLDARGVYVKNEKICSLGLRISKGCSLHGLALNVTVDLTPFLIINPCGYANMKMTKIQNFDHDVSITKVKYLLVSEFTDLMNYNYIKWQ
ncbi:lipoyl(octanoyl) transferase LipB [Candidatus Pantoea edessiphila]|uniref:Octanoyltransferase n=1 Tax=Candidatus Pantoea edessiphila TaxID=2044610 RepID=A0A2P5SX68_9GAMM|nr:lipoyl(octanoyl) transferase LipB [Candidatus Pantoea edessiphila]PPI86903.1 octanoyltransferase [Candidatus Pantoea edessiphila]